MNSHSKCRRRTVFSFFQLESRINCAFVSNVLDYDRPYDPINNQNSIPIPGSLRYELQAAMDYYDANGVPDTITFDTKLAGQTIQLNWGSLEINRPVVIQAPKAQFPLANYDFVTVKWAHWSAANDPMNPLGNYGSDWSALKINLPATEPELEANYARGVSLAGLKITGGRGRQGGGIQAEGIFSLSILASEISGNTLSRVNDAGDTFGGGLWTNGAEFGKSRRVYGPRVSIVGSKIHGNATDSNDNDPNPGIDYGGGVYLGYGSSLFVSKSTFSNNVADNGGAAIYMVGGAFYEDATVFEPQPVFTTALQVRDSVFVENAITSYSANGPGGAIMITDTTAAMIADTSFNFNQAKSHGGAIHITGPGGIGPNNVSPYSQLIGEVNIVGCTFEGNLAAQIGKDNNGDDVIRENGSGGAINSDGIHNRVFLVNSTLGGNSTTIGKGGAVAVQPFQVYYDHIILFEKSFDGRTLSQSKDQGPRPPGPHPGTTLLVRSSMAFANLKSSARVWPARWDCSKATVMASATTIGKSLAIKTTASSASSVMAMVMVK
jgi:hypothetical protein